jgi:hypothetical protein
MASKHEIIIRKIMIDWTRDGRGRIFKNDTGAAWRGKLAGERIEAGSRAIELFGAVLIKYGLCPGSSDLIGWELVEYMDINGPVTVPIFCAIEVKTGKDRVKENQKNWLDAVARMGGRAYLAREAGDGYIMEEWTI